LFVSGMALLAATVGAPAESASGRKGGTLRLAAIRDVDYVDPALAYFPVAGTLESATCATLFNNPDEAGAAGTRVIPEVAAGFPIVSPNGRVYTFDLKRTFRFHTGAAVTARNFAEAFNRDANPKMKSPAVTYMHEIVGADAVIKGKATTISGVRVLAPYRLQIRLTKPLGDLTARLTMPFFCPLWPNTPVDPAGIDNPPGSGPYYVAERIPNRQVVLRRNRFYRGGRPANVDEIVFTVMGAEACRLAVEKNQIDYCSSIPQAAYRELAAKYGINRPNGQFFVSPALATLFFSFNHDRPAFKGPGQIPLKKAINHALDRPELVRAHGYLAGVRTDQMLPPALGRDADVYSLKRAEPATARRWLDRARIKPSTLVLYAWNGPAGVAAAQVFKFNLKQIGIDVEVKYFAPEVALEKALTPGEPYDVVFGGWGVDYADPASFYVPLLAGNASRSNLADPAVNARIAAADRLEGDARRKAWADLDAELMRTNPPWAPYLHTAQRAFVSKSYGCFLTRFNGNVNLVAACKK
jgi:ABC-type oligopeptide transport system substrate-binding subunit